MFVSNYNIKLTEGDISNHNAPIKNVMTVLLTISVRKSRNGHSVHRGVHPPKGGGQKDHPPKEDRRLTGGRYEYYWNAYLFINTLFTGNN